MVGIIWGGGHHLKAADVIWGQGVFFGGCGRHLVGGVICVFVFMSSLLGIAVGIVHVSGW